MTLFQRLSHLTRIGCPASASHTDMRRHQSMVILMTIAISLTLVITITLNIVQPGMFNQLKIAGLFWFILSLVLLLRGYRLWSGVLFLCSINVNTYISCLEAGKESFNIIYFLCGIPAVFICFRLREWWWIMIFMLIPPVLVARLVLTEYQVPPILGFLNIHHISADPAIMVIVGFLITMSVIAGMTAFFVYTNARTEEIVLEQLQSSRENERHLLSVLSAVTDPIWITNTNLGVVIANDAFHDVYYSRFGVPFSRSNIREVPNSPAEEALWKPRYTLTLQGKTQQFFNSFVTIQGKRIWESVTLAPLILDGEIIGTVGIARNITDAKEAELHISATVAQLQALVTSLDDIVCQVNQTGFVSEVWVSGTLPMSETARQLRGKHIRLLADDAGDMMMTAITNTFITRRSHTIEYLLKRTGHWYQAKFSFVEQNHSVTVLIADISQRKENDKQIQALNSQLKELNMLYAQVNRDLADSNVQLESRVEERTAELRSLTQQLQEENSIRQQAEQRLSLALQREQTFSDMKSRFVTMLSHQFRTPLTLIQNGLDIVSSLLSRNESIRRVQVDRHLQSMMDGTDQIVALIERVATLTDIQTGILQEQAKEFRIEDVIQTIVDECIFHAEGQPADIVKRIQIVLPDYALPPVRTSYTAIHVAQSELLKNALLYAYPDSMITIHISLTDQSPLQICIATINEGQAISIADQRSIFENFYRTGAAQTVGQTRGLGMGLNLAQFCARALCGAVVYDDIANNQIRFSLTFPVILPQ